MFLEPFIGDNYYNLPENERIMIFGESHYYTDGPFDNTVKTSDYTKKVVEKIIGNAENSRFFYRVGSLFNANWTAIWKNVAFANLIQYVFNSLNKQPEKGHIQTIDSFYKYLEICEPAKVIICSSRMWDKWFSWHIDDKEGVELIKDLKMGISHPCIFPYSEGKTIGIGINHPSDRVPDDEYKQMESRGGGVYQF